MNKGFTLVELSIVLVIIGLLIGGILVGQTLIEAAKLNNTVRQIQQYDIALSNFKSKYKNTMPGDSKFFGGNGNNILESAPRNEIGNFWPDVQKSGFNAGGKTFTATITGSFKTGSNTPNIPLLPLGTNTGVILTTEDELISDGSTGCTNMGYKYIYNLANFSGNNWAGPTVTPSLKAEQALGIDSKIDDGKALTGKVQGMAYLTMLGGGGGNCIENADYVGDPNINDGMCDRSLSISTMNETRGDFCLYYP